MIRKTLLLFLLGSWLPLFLLAQPVITKSCNGLRVGDHLVKQQVLYKDPGRTGENVLWDFSRQEAVNEHYELEYYGNPDSLLIGQEHRMLYKYLVRGDTLLSAGFENRATLIDHRVPELLLVYPMQYGHKHEGYFHGNGDYCNQLFVGASGKTTIEADAFGMIVLPEGDTLRHVLRVCHTKKLSERMVPYPFIQKSDTVFSADSVNYRLSHDTLTMQVQTYRWYAEGYRYPVFETVENKVFVHNRPETYSSAAFYYKPVDQYYDIGNDPENQFKRDRSEELLQANKDKGNFSQNAPPEEDIINYNVGLKNGGNTLALEYYLNEDAEVCIMLFDMQGRQLTNLRKGVQAAGVYSENISLHGFQPGEYTLRIVVNGIVYGVKIIK